MNAQQSAFDGAEAENTETCELDSVDSSARSELTEHPVAVGSSFECQQIPCCFSAAFSNFVLRRPTITAAADVRHFADCYDVLTVIFEYLPSADLFETRRINRLWHAAFEDVITSHVSIDQQQRLVASYNADVSLSGDRDRNHLSQTMFAVGFATGTAALFIFLLWLLQGNRQALAALRLCSIIVLALLGAVLITNAVIHTGTAAVLSGAKAVVMLLLIVSSSCIALHLGTEYYSTTSLRASAIAVAECQARSSGAPAISEPPLQILFLRPSRWFVSGAITTDSNIPFRLLKINSSDLENLNCTEALMDPTAYADVVARNKTLRNGGSHSVLSAPEVGLYGNDELWGASGEEEELPLIVQGLLFEEFAKTVPSQGVADAWLRTSLWVDQRVPCATAVRQEAPPIGLRAQYRAGLVITAVSGGVSLLLSATLLIRFVVCERRRSIIPPAAPGCKKQPTRWFLMRPLTKHLLWWLLHRRKLQSDEDPVARALHYQRSTETASTSGDSPVGMSAAPSRAGTLHPPPPHAL